MKTTKTFVTNSLDDLRETAKRILSELSYPLVLLIGDLGAGKTTLVKEILQQLGSEDAGSSPSYSLINEYKIAEGQLYHLDLYRLTSVEEAFALGLEDLIYSGSRCIIEWPQLIADRLEAPFCILKIEVAADESRTIELSFVES